MRLLLPRGLLRPPQQLGFHFKKPGKMEKHKVVPDVLEREPKEKCEAVYEGGTVKVDMGNILTPTQVKDPPTVTWKCKAGVFYLLCVVDPDAPSRKEPKQREWHHWLVGNIPKTDVASGYVLSEYIGAAPPKGTGLHRYVIVVYEQATKLEFTEKKLVKTSAEGRGKFCISKFATKYHLGAPIAGNFFQAEWDDHVPKIYKQLGQ